MAITNGGFKAGDEGVLTDSFDIAYPVAGDSTASAETSTDVLFTVTPLADTAYEGKDEDTGEYTTPYKFTITPNAALMAEYKVKWEIILDGKLPAGFNDFEYLSDDVTFTKGATIGQTITLPIIDDAERADVKTFSIHLTLVDDENVQIGEYHAVTLIDDDTGNFTSISLENSTQHDTLVAG